DLHVEQAQEAAAKAKAQRLRDLGFEHQRGIVKLQLLERIAQLVVFAAFDRIQTGKYLRLDLFEAWQGRRGLLARQGDGVAHLGMLELFDAGDHKTDLAGRELL